MTGVEIAAVAGAASSLLGTGANAYATGRLNKKNRKFQKELYEQQRADNERQWHMTNQYNTPLSQMNRLKEAGLNPMLMYGSGAGGAGNAGSTPTSATFQNYEDKPPNFDFSSLGGYIGFRQQAAQTDNTRANTRLLAVQEDKLRADIANTTIDTINKTNIDKIQKRELEMPLVETAYQTLTKLQAETEAIPQNVKISQQNADANTANSLTNADNARTQAHQAQTNRMSAESNILRNKYLNHLTTAEADRVKQVTQTEVYKTAQAELETALRAKGINPQDPTWLRMSAQLAEEWIKEPIKDLGLWIERNLKGGAKKMNYKYFGR